LRVSGFIVGSPGVKESPARGRAVLGVMGF
jgi:hypothetical protein